MPAGELYIWDIYFEKKSGGKILIKSSHPNKVFNQFAQKIENIFFPVADSAVIKIYFQIRYNLRG